MDRQTLINTFSLTLRAVIKCMGKPKAGSQEVNPMHGNTVLLLLV